VAAGVGASVALMMTMKEIQMRRVYTRLDKTRNDLD
jgi:hypothetical protein